ncbi:MAG: alpha/beta fold hydrolase [Acidimicrobiia bacterium]|nr:alpha/beta fold hydrolase [Acidimicrobiia bacterium]
MSTPTAALGAWQGFTDQLAPGVDEAVVDVRGHPARVWSKGHGEPLAWLAGPLGVPRWTPFLDRLADHRRVVVPSLPGFPGASDYEHLDNVADWVTATLDLLDAAGVEGADLAGHSIGGSLAAEVAAFSRGSVRRLVLVSPYGLYDDERPPKNLWAMRSGPANMAMSRDRARIEAQVAVPEGGDEVEWPIEMQRAVVAGARMFWPLCDLGLGKRLHRVTAPTLVVWGEEDAALDGRYAERFADGISGPVTVARVAGAGHLVDLDAPDALADRIEGFLAG